MDQGKAESSLPGSTSTIPMPRTSRRAAMPTEYAGRPYDGTVAWSDELVGRLVDALRQSGALDDTLVIVTSDHGEALGRAW